MPEINWTIDNTEIDKFSFKLLSIIYKSLDILFINRPKNIKLFI
jgi:hypothetical protein